VDPLVSVITIIEKEHTEILGDTLEKIAREKAGIIKKDRPLVLGKQSEEALQVFRNRAAETGSPVLYFPEIAGIDRLRIDREGVSFDLSIRLARGGCHLENLRISIPGRVQAENAGLAVLAVKTAFPGIGEKAFREGLESFTLPARFEVICRDPLLVADGAHTASSAAECVQTFTTLYGRGGVLLFGCAAGKDAASMARSLIPCFSRVIITTPGSFKKSCPLDVYEIFKCTADELKKSAGEGGGEILCIPETRKALDRAVELGKELALPVLAAGSFYLAAEIRNCRT
jgi:dihydrofolate synthase/folylpolyglutamate synthase